MIRELKYARKAALSGKASSLVMFLHGYGADGADLFGLSAQLAPHLHDTVFLSPDAPEPCSASAFGRQWFGIPRFDGSTAADAEAGMRGAARDLNHFLSARLEDEGLDDKALAIIGFSQGAMMALQIAPRREVAMAAVVAISGRLVLPERLAAETVVRPPVLLIHGDCDEVVNFGEMERAGQALVGAGFETFGHVMQGSGHGIAPDGLSVALGFLRARLPA